MLGRWQHFSTAMATSSLVLLLAGISSSPVLAKPLPSPPSFKDSRRAIFLQADCNRDGVVSESSTAGCKNGVSELQRLFDIASELRMVFVDIQSMQVAADREHLVPKQLTKAVLDGRFTEKQWIVLSMSAIKAIVSKTAKAGQLWILAVAFLQLHLWKLANKKFEEADKKSNAQEREEMYPMMCNLARQFQDHGLYLEASHMWRKIRTFFKDPDSTVADSFAEHIPKLDAPMSLEPVPPSFSEASYIARLRQSSNASCPEIAAKEEDFLAAIRKSQPVVMRASHLVPDIKAWDAALRKHGDAVVLSHVTPDGKFYGTTTRKAPEDARRNTTWVVMPAKQPVRLGKIPAVASIKGARFYIQGRDLFEIDPALADWVGGPPRIARKLYPSATQLWAGLGGGSASLIHEDTWENILAQVHGTKEVLLWPPQDKAHLYGAKKPELNVKFQCCPPKFKPHVGEEVVYNSNVGAADIRRPRKWAEKTAPTLCRISAGDALIIPSGWHHAVLSHPGEVEACEHCGAIANLAVNFWFLKYAYGSRKYTKQSEHLEL